MRWRRCAASASSARRRRGARRASRLPARPRARGRARLHRAGAQRRRPPGRARGAEREGKKNASLDLQNYIMTQMADKKVEQDAERKHRSSGGVRDAAAAARAEAVAAALERGCRRRGRGHGVKQVLDREGGVADTLGATPPPGLRARRAQDDHGRARQGQAVGDLVGPAARGPADADGRQGGPQARRAPRCSRRSAATSSTSTWRWSCTRRATGKQKQRNLLAAWGATRAQPQETRPFGPGACGCTRETLAKAGAAPRELRVGAALGAGFDPRDAAPPADA